MPRVDLACRFYVCRVFVHVEGCRSGERRVLDALSIGYGDVESHGGAGPLLLGGAEPIVQVLHKWGGERAWS